MNPWKVILATLVIFGTGVVTGGLLVYHTSQAPFRRPRLEPRPPNAAGRLNGAPRQTNRVFNPPGAIMPGLRRDFLRNLDRELELTADQRAHIGKILADGQEHTKKLWDQIAPDVRGEWIRIKARIRAELTPEQRQHFEQMMRHPRRLEERRNPPSPANPPPVENP